MDRAATLSVVRDTLAWPYSPVVDAKRDRVVTTNSSMPVPSWLSAPAGSWRKSRVDSIVTAQMQLWTLSRLKLLRTIALPTAAGATPIAGYTANEFPAEPHWLASDPRSSGVVLTGTNMGQVLIVNVDPRTGRLTVDRNFRDDRTGAAGVSLDGRAWPQGTVARAFVHGSLFGPR
jgi:hypothetical protein